MRLFEMRLATAVTALAGLTAQIAALSNGPPLKFDTLSPEEQKQQLDDSARQDPSSVRYVPGVDIPKDVVHPQLVTDSSSGSKSAPKTDGGYGCTNPDIHYEWRDASEIQRQDFVSALFCLTKTSPRSGQPAVANRWDDLVAVHRANIYTVHNTGAFLHWHRYFLWVLKQELRNACAYTGPMLWWDETKDAGHFANAPMMNGDYLGDFPTDPEPQNITNGKFRNLELHLGPVEDNTNRTLFRQGTESNTSRISTDAVNTCYSWNLFANMSHCFENGPHGAGHNGIGGIMQDVFSSPGDPLFFLHHGFIDRIFWKWQQFDPANRTMAVGGIKVRGCTENCEMVTLDYELSSVSFAPSYHIYDVADTLGDLLCYQYNY